MNIIYPISYITNPLKDALSLFLSEVTVLFPFNDDFISESESLKINLFKDFNTLDINLFSPQDISKIIQWASQFENFSHSILSDTLQAEIHNESINEILKGLNAKASSLSLKKQDSENNTKQLLLTRFFYEYDKKQDEINSNYNEFQEKFKNLSKILNGDGTTTDTKDNEIINLNPMDFNLLKPELRLKIWVNLFDKINYKGDINLIGISKEIRDIIMDSYYDIKGELPELLLELDLENINRQTPKNHEIEALINKIWSLNTLKTSGKNDIINDLTKDLINLWNSHYKPKENSVIKIYFMILRGVTLRDLLFYYARLKDKNEITISEGIEVAIFIG